MAVTYIDLSGLIWWRFDFEPCPFSEGLSPVIRGKHVSPCFWLGSNGSPDGEDNYIDGLSELEPPSKRQKTGKSSSENEDKLHNSWGNDDLHLGGCSIGNLPLSSKEIGEGSYEGRPVTCTLDDFIQERSASSNNSVFPGDLWTKDGHLLPLVKKKLMRNVILELGHLHDSRRIYGDLKPQKVLIMEDRSLCAKLLDMCKRLLGETSSLGSHATGCGNSGWQAPEQLRDGRQSCATDVFSLGCVLFLLSTGGKHPFGEPQERDDNILNDKMDLSLEELTPEARYMFSRMLNRKPELRPEAWEVLSCYWDPMDKVYFYFRFSDVLHSKNPAPNPNLLKELESKEEPVFDGDWIDKIHPRFRAEIKKRHDKYNYSSVGDLLRFIRNKWAHINQQKILGRESKHFYSYFAAQFPSLWMKSYSAAYRFCREEDWFQESLLKSF